MHLLYDYAQTDRQRTFLEVLDKVKTTAAAAKKIDPPMSERGARRMLATIKGYAAKRGYAPDDDFTHLVPEGFSVKGISTYYDAEDERKGRWVKTSIDAERQEELQQAAITALCSEIKPAKPIKAPKKVAEDLANVYTFTDSHVGMLAWRKEGGADWDLKIAEKTLTDSFAAMIDGAPTAKLAIISQLGDFMHFDGLVAQTPMNKHPLDADGRFGKIVEVAIRILRKIINLALQKHQKVRVVMAEGNHDIVSSIWLRKMFAALYELDPRVTIDDSELPYYVYQHGEIMLAFHHGHLKRKDGLPSLFAAQFPKVWGATVKRYAHCGHMHHVNEKEDSGMLVIQHPTLAARDAYAARYGFLSERAATAMTFHKKFGRVATNTVCPEMLG